MAQDIPPGLVWYPDTRPGISRRRAGLGWSYRAPNGTTIDCPKERARIEAIAIPPAYGDVWISPREDGHLQGTGRDEARRKQYRYHPQFKAFKDATKFDDLVAFGRALPSIRRRVREALQGDPDGREFAIAAALRLMDRASLRVGSPEYTEDRRIYGATTLRGRHVTLGDREIQLRYRGKGGQMVTKRIKDQALQRALQRMDDLPGGALMQWQDAGGDTHRIGPDQVNLWLQDQVESATAKTFRTWNGTVAALEMVLQSDADVTIRAMSQAAAKRLHNTATIARNAYIHPAVIDLAGCVPDVPVPDRPHGLRQPERVLLALLEG